ncbi:FAD-dependent oxidoreductase [Parahaliea aestuarii]|uniref:NAD(P)-binding protein n=1 Tax=Parahaliea aestuarii TaxID=1852021 RepID=A0A5C8ZW34_9GAMM|nr:FAD-dependent oxidoreductase [Parahaliea aestuarii]TXS91802.1 NAD(P)-binding protein [Parahaliea aestuarii]
MSSALPHLMAPGRIGALTLRNRIIMSPMGSNMAEPDGFCGERIQQYYERRAAGGAAMVIMGSVGISWPLGSPNWRQVAISDDKYNDGLKALVAGVHRHGALAAVQLHHGGLESINDSQAGRPLLCPSEPEHAEESLTPYLSPDEIATLSEPYTAETCKVHYKIADTDDIAWVIEQFVGAAERAKRCGFDAVEIHAGHGYLISSFLSPSVNKRHDNYGGSIENRSRLLVEVITAIKSRVGKEFPVWFRMDSHQFATGGITNEDACVTARLAVAAGADAVHCSADGDHSTGTCYTEGHSTHVPAGFSRFAAAVKSCVDVPVIMPGRVEPEVGDRLIKEQKIDFVTMARKLLADPDLPNKIQQNRLKDIRPCIYCYTCISQIFLRRHVICAVNAETGFETERSISPSEVSRNVAVIGGGPAGMEAARVAALRGHRVTLLEKSSRLGGTVFFSGASYPPNSKLVAYLREQMKTLSVDIRLNTEATPALLDHLAPDKVVVANGCSRKLPDVPGIDLPHVLDGDQIRSLVTGEGLDALESKVDRFTRVLLSGAALSRVTSNMALVRQLSKIWMPLGKRIVFIGGGLVAVELAEFLAARGREVTLLEEGSTFGRELMLVRRWRNMADIEKLGVQCIPRATVRRVSAGTVTYVNDGGQERTIGADHVILTTGTIENPTLADALENHGFDVLTAGDCNGVTYIEGAMREGYLAGQSV